MERIEVTPLPGIGVMRTFLTAAGDWIGVLEMPSGHRQLFLDDPSDPDARRLVAELHPDDSIVLARLLGFDDRPGTADDTPSQLVDWVQVPRSSPAVGQTIGELELRSRTGATIAAVLRDHAHADVDPTFRLRADDILVLTGGQAALAAAAAHLQVGPDARGTTTGT